MHGVQHAEDSEHGTRSTVLGVRSRRMVPGGLKWEYGARSTVPGVWYSEPGAQARSTRSMVPGVQYTQNSECCVAFGVVGAYFLCCQWWRLMNSSFIAILGLRLHHRVSWVSVSLIFSHILRSGHFFSTQGKYLEFTAKWF